MSSAGGPGPSPSAREPAPDPGTDPGSTPAPAPAPAPAVDLLLDPFGASWPAVRDAARAAEAAGVGGLWMWDHLSGQAHGADGVLECWTSLTALAAVVPRVALGPLVLNVAYRRPAVLATMAATLQQVSGGRLIVGVGAGGGRAVPYTAEQRAIGLPVPPDPVRRRQVDEALHVLRQLWSGRAEAFAGEHFPLGDLHGFLRPDPTPPVVVAAFGPKMARLAGMADGVTTHAGHPDRDRIVDLARLAHAAAAVQAGRAPGPFLVILTAPLTDRWLDPEVLAGLAADGVDRLVLQIRPPYDADLIARAGAAGAAGAAHGPRG